MKIFFRKIQMFFGLNLQLFKSDFDWSVQGPPSEFDIMYLSLAGRNMQVRFGLKVDWES